MFYLTAILALCIVCVQPSMSLAVCVDDHTHIGHTREGVPKRTEPAGSR